MSPEFINEKFKESTDEDQKNLSEALYKTAQCVKRGVPLNNNILEELTEEYELEFDFLKEKAKELNKTLRLEGMPEAGRVREIIQEMLTIEDENEEVEVSEEVEVEPVVEGKDNTAILQKSLVGIGNIVFSGKHLTNLEIEEIALENDIAFKELKSKALELNKQILSKKTKDPKVVELLVQEMLGLEIEGKIKNDNENLDVTNGDKYQKAREELKALYMKNPTIVTKELVMGYGLGDSFFSEIKSSLPEWGRERSQTQIIQE